MTVVLDFETRSEADLKKVGAAAYSEHPSTEIICASWVTNVPGSSTLLRGNWLNQHLGQAYPEPSQHGGLVAGPQELLIRAADGAIFEAHNIGFEYMIWLNICVKRYGWPEIPIPRWRDSMAVACYYAMPAALDPLLKVLGLPGKNPDGKRLITKYSKLHLKTAKREIPPEDLAKFVAYCDDDAEGEYMVGEILGELPAEELEIFLHDLAVNVRGIRLDANGLAAAREVVEIRAEELRSEFTELTDLGPGQRDRILEWFLERGVELPNLQAAMIDELLDEGTIENEAAPPLTHEMRKVLAVRRQHARASTKKLDTMLRQRSLDGRARFQTRYHGAATGRNTGTGFQPLNLVRSWDNMDPEQLVRDVMLGDPQWLDMIYGDAMEAVGKASRYWITADEGSRIMAGDFVSIEAVVNACLAGEEWKIQLFRDKGDPYCSFASQVTGREVLGKKDPNVTTQDKLDRQLIGKPGELAFGYQGAVAAWRKFDPSDKWEDEDILGFVRGWRDLHPNIKDQWRGLEDAAHEAVAYPGRVTGWRDQELFERVDGWLTMILPDGKRLWYWAPEIRMTWPQWHRPLEHEDCAALACDCKKRPQVSYMARKEGQWKRTYSYGGKWCENRVQAVSRQMLKAMELRVAAAGYPIVLSVYDEAVCELPWGRGSREELKEIMEVPAGDWCADWPIRAEVWEGPRYKK